MSAYGAAATSPPNRRTVDENRGNMELMVVRSIFDEDLVPRQEGERSKIKGENVLSLGDGERSRHIIQIEERRNR